MFSTWALKSDIHPENFVDCPTYDLAQNYFNTIKKKLAPHGDCRLYDEISFFSRIFRQKDEAKSISLKDLQLKDLMLDRASIASPLRVSTPSVKLVERKEERFEEVNFTNYLPQIKKKIKSKHTHLTKEERKDALQLIHSMELFIQLLFNESLAEIYLQKLKERFAEDKNLLGLFQCLKKYDFDTHHFSKFDVLKNRQEFTRFHDALKISIKAIEDEHERRQLLAYLQRAKTFFYQRNDLNFTYATKPSRCFSGFKDKLELWGGRLGLAATIGAIVCSVALFVFPFCPFAVPAALISGLAIASLVCTAVMVLTNLPQAMKNLGTAIYNYARFGVAPTYREVISVGLIGLSLLSAGVGGIVGGMVHSTLFGNISGSLLTTSNLIKVGVKVQKEQQFDFQSGTKKHINEGYESKTVPETQADREPLLLSEGSDEEEGAGLSRRPCS